MSNFIRKIKREVSTPLNRAARKAEYKKYEQTAEDAEELRAKGEQDKALVLLQAVATNVRVQRIKNLAQSKINSIRPGQLPYSY